MKPVDPAPSASSPSASPLPQFFSRQDHGTFSADTPRAPLVAGANFRARLKFPPEYPLMPPALTFQDPIPFHPNVYPDTGLLCISILHPPEEDKYGYEAASERWSPVQTPETILLSVISLFASPNDESPANPEAAKLLREERAGANKDFRKRVRKCVRESLGED